MKPPVKMSIIVMLAIFCSSIVMAQSYSEYYPLKVGSKWTLEGYGTDPTFSYKVIGTEKIDGSLYAKIESKLISQGNEQSLVYYARCEENRIYRREPDKKEELFFDFNAEINQSWVKFITHNDSTRGAITGRITGRNLTVKVPAGVFDRCIVHEITDARKTNDRISTVLYTYWMAPDVGVVKITVNISGVLTPVDLWVNELSSYYIPSPK